MEVNTAYNVPFPGNQSASFVKAADIAIPGFKTPQEIRQTEIQEKVMMDLEEVQNFLYMLIGSELQVKEDRGLKGTSLNFSA